MLDSASSSTTAWSLERMSARSMLGSLPKVPYVENCPILCWRHWRRVRRGFVFRELHVDCPMGGSTSAEAAASMAWNRLCGRNPSGLSETGTATTA